MSRDAEIDAFLAAHGHAGAARAPLAGDASARRYERVAGLVLMDAPPGSGEDVRPFLDVAGRLGARGLSVPRIEAADPEAGLVLMEDLGDALFARHVAAHPGDEPALYVAAAETLAAMAEAPADGLPDYRLLMPEFAGLALDWYAPEALDRRAALVAAVGEALAALPGPARLVHRDWHAENLLWLPKREGTARVGILDFQDAAAGPAEYDMASMLHDVRRDVAPEAIDAACARWLALSGRSEEDARRGFAVASAQRNLRILGVFARLCLRDGKRRYPDWIPRTWMLLQRDLAHPALAGVRAIVERAIPAPTEARLDAIRAAAGTRRGEVRAR
ncbi:aminoglycoside phosphotransferase family protein [Jannaschia sp. W003]|uniref:aminoglycoside phosphotransferase family protein n=1 Tax=Jannaschia sp. W003 TaxID=2867012 RepID=UPI0021A42729|nr:phosphotransferase [Jannaschia sp. W003]UWQ21614.1 phosphotransferase [Jannaschia sp. W003]